MELSYQHSQNQRILRQRNMLGVATVVLAGVVCMLFIVWASRDREVILQPILRSPLTISSSGVTKDYLEAVTRDAAILTLDRSPQNLEYWMNAVLEITAPSAQGRLKADLLKIVDEQRGSSIAQFIAINAIKVDTHALLSEVTGDLHTIVGSKVISKDRRTFQFRWKYSGVTLQLIGFGMVVPEKGKPQ